MIERVIVKGYQSLYDISVDLGQFTVIYGETNVGKSAFYRAIRGLITAELGDSFISKGVDICKVGLSLSSGESVVWLKKRGKSSEYALSKGGKSKRWQRNRSLPVEIGNLLKFGEIVVDGDRFYPNLRSQFDSLFLLFETPGKRARVLGSLISNILLKGIRQANVERNRNEADIRSLNKLYDDLERRKDFDWNGLLSKIKATNKVLYEVEKAETISEKILELESSRLEFEALTKFAVDFLPDSLFKELDKFVSVYIDTETLSVNLEQAKECLESYDENLKQYLKDKEDLEKELGELEEKLTFECPNCGYSISKLEIDI